MVKYKKYFSNKENSMKNYARIIAMLCAMVMLLGCFVACANTQDPTETTEAAQTQTPAEQEGELTVDLNLDKDGFWKDDLPQLNYNETVTILNCKSDLRTSCWGRIRSSHAPP